MAARADAAPPPASRGLAVAGELGLATGLGEAARIYAHAAGALGFGGQGPKLGVGQKPQGKGKDGSALLLAVNPPSLGLMLARAGRGFLQGQRVIGSWVWELPVLPPSWLAGGDYVHEIWAPSPFTADLFEAVFPGRVRLVPYPLALAGVQEADPCADVPDKVVITLIVLSLGSSFARKNPLAGIAAFRRAFAGRADQLLVVKLSGAEAYPAEAAAITAQARGNIKIFSGSWSPERMAALMQRADIVLSLHRAEGFGLVLAEAMLRGKPVVATGWSGNLGFMDEASAALIGYELVPMRDESGVYQRLAGARWAEPDIDHAAAWLLRLGEDAALRADFGAKARLHAALKLSGAEMRAALAANGVAPL